jgi:8-oxo-dGTP diphosphatase
VLITARKVDCTAFVDDRAVHHEHGDSWAETFAAVDALRDRRQGFHSCIPGQHRHYGRDGAAGILPVATFRGRQYALLSKRSKSVQCGGTWSTVGGAIEPGETPLDAAQREAREEIDGLRLGDENAMAFSSACPHGCGWSYVTHVVRTELGKPRVKDTWENSGLLWRRLDDVAALDLHPAFRASWPQLSASIGAGQS